MSYTLAEIRNGTGFEPGTRFEIARGDGGQVEVTFRKEVTPDDRPDLSWLDQTDKEMGEGFEAESQKRKEAYHRGDWHMIGVRAVAHITVVRKDRTATYTLRSPGVWGVESDSSEEYLQEIFDEECAALRADIDALCAQKVTYANRPAKEVQP